MSRTRVRVVIITGLVALYTPSSIGGQISAALGAVGLIAITALLFMLLVQRGGVGAPIQMVCATGVLVTLALATAVSPLERISPGLIPIFASAAMLLALRLPPPGDIRPLHRAFMLIHVISLTLGYALALDVRPADRLVLQWYSAFYPDLLGNMVVLNNKPVLTFGTHSMAGFMVYLLFYEAYSAWRLRDSRWHLAIGLGYLGLLLALTSTTSLALAIVAAGQLAVRVAQRHREALPTAIFVSCAVSLLALIYLGYSPVRLWQLATDAVLGDRIRGLASRYAEGGMLARNFEYLSKRPLAPIGLGFSESLYLGDSGLLLSVMRGSVPLTLFLYGGWYALCAQTLTSRAAALWLTVVTVAFEVGFTPLQYFRFVGFVPLYLTMLESLRPVPAPAVPADGGALYLGVPEGRRSGALSVAQ